MNKVSTASAAVGRVLGGFKFDLHINAPGWLLPAVVGVACGIAGAWIFWNFFTIED